MNDLFNASYAPILHRYPLAEAASADIRLRTASGSVALEQFLRERLRDSEDPYAQRRFFQVPLYLQELLFSVSRTDGNGYTEHPENYDALVNACLALERVSFVTLNYDTLLDQRLFIYSRLDTLASYIDPNERWALFKLHGSVNWVAR